MEPAKSRQARVRDKATCGGFAGGEELFGRAIGFDGQAIRPQQRRKRIANGGVVFDEVDCWRHPAVP